MKGIQRYQIDRQKSFIQKTDKTMANKTEMYERETMQTQHTTLKTRAGVLRILWK